MSINMMLKDQFLLDPEVIFLNHGSFGACPKPVFEVYQKWQRKLEQQPVQFLGVDLDGYLYEARKILGNFIHTEADNIVYVPNATHGVNIVAHSLHLNPGDEILTSNHEYGACNFAWEFNCKANGAVYKTQGIKLPITTNADVVDQLWEGVTRNTRVIFISHITSPTAIKMPVELICERARQEGIITVIDGAHAPGQIPLDLSSLGADFYSGNCHKWMMSPKGAGFLYVRPDMQDRIEPLVVSWGYQSKTSMPKVSRFIDFLQWTGTKDPAAALSVPAAIQFMHDYHWEELRQGCHILLRNAMERMGNLTGMPPIYPIDSDFYHQMATIRIPKIRDVRQLKSRLYDEYKIEIPMIDWENQHFIRLSIQGYNSEDQVQVLLKAMEKLLPELSL